MSPALPSADPSAVKQPTGLFPASQTLAPVDLTPTALAGPTVVCETLDEGGWVRARTSLQGATLHGPLQLYSAEGIPAAELHYRSGQRDGVQRLYDEQGCLAQEAGFTVDRQHGPTRIWVDGRLLTVQQFMAGLLQGETVCYGDAGEITARLHYAQGELDGESLFFHEGALVRRSLYRKGKLEGATTDYHPTGHPVQLAHYQANVLHGTLRRFWPNGQVMEQVEYCAGRPVGRPAHFNAQGVPAGLGKGAALLNRFEKIVRG